MNYPLYSALSPYQKALWHQQAYPITSPANNMTCLLVCREPIKRLKMAYAAHKSSQSFPLLRAYFYGCGEEMVMKFNTQKALDYQSIDLSPLDESARFREVAKWASQEIDVKRALIKIFFFIWSSNETRILISWHHSIGDIFSLNLFIKIFLDALLGKTAENKVESGSYLDFISWQAEFLKSEKCQIHADYWSAKVVEIEKMPITNLLLGEADIVHFHFEKPEIARFLAYCAQEKLTLAQLFFLAYQLFLHDIRNTEQLVTMMPFNTRVKKAYIESIGYYVNFLPFISKFYPHSAIKEYCRAMRQDLMHAMLHSSYPVNVLFDLSVNNYKNQFKNIFKFQNETIFSKELIDYQDVLDKFGRIEKILSLDDNLVNYPRGELTLILSVSEERTHAAFHFVKTCFERHIVEDFPSLYRQKLETILTQI